MIHATLREKFILLDQVHGSIRIILALRKRYPMEEVASGSMRENNADARIGMLFSPRNAARRSKARLLNSNITAYSYLPLFKVSPCETRVLEAAI